MGLDFPVADLLPDEQGQEAKVILLLGQSNATGYSLHHHWLCGGQRGSIYEACMGFIRAYMDYLLSCNYDARIGAICWMQRESDTTDFKASRYYDNQAAFVSYPRADLAQYTADGGIYFVDAGISNSPYCLPSYPAINEAKARFSKLSPLNLYFSTIDEGFTTLYEPEENPDLGHYDALSELQLGRMFGQYIVRSYEMRK